MKIKPLFIAALCCLSSTLLLAQGTGSSTNPFTNLYVTDFVKIGTNSLWLSSTNSGVDNSIYTTGGDLRINDNEGQGSIFNTLINPDESNVGIGLYNPLGKLDIDLGVHYHTKEAGVRITIPQREYMGNSSDTTNESIFEVRRDVGTNPLVPIYETEVIVDENGQMGIAIEDPRSKLHVHNGRIQVTGTNAYGGPMILFGGNETNAPGGQFGIEYMSTGNSGLNFWKPYYSNNYENYLLYLTDEGQIGMGVNPNQFTDFAQDSFRLHVEGGIIAEKVKVALLNDWPDYVFAPEYDLLPLNAVADYIEENGHLPNVPSAEEVEDNGINLAEMDATLLEKIEELTLYMIQLQEENAALKNDMDTLKSALK